MRPRFAPARSAIWVLSLRCRLLEVYRLFIEKYSSSQHEICKTLFEVLYAVIQKQFHVIYNDPIEKKKTTRKSSTDWT